MPAWILSRPSGIPDPIAIGSIGVPVTAAYATTVVPEVGTSSSVLIAPTDGVGFTISAPVGLVVGQRVLFTIRNASGGALGTVTWNAIYKLATWTSPANGNSRSIEFLYDGSHLVEITRTTNDIPN